MSILAPIALFVYNRPDHTRQTIQALQANELASDSELFVYSDGAKNEASVQKVQEVRKYIHSVSGFMKITVIERDKNWGLANSIIDGVTTIIKQYGSIIVVEDDLVTSPYFLRFMNDGLEAYRDDAQVASIHGYIYPLKHSNTLPKNFFIRGADCWGWATWDRAWANFNPNGSELLAKIKHSSNNTRSKFNFSGTYNYISMLEDQISGKNNSWAVRWYASAFLKDMLTLYPSTSFVRNIGHDNSGTHCTENNNFDSPLVQNYQTINRTNINESLPARQAIEVYFASIKLTFLDKLISKLKKSFYDH